MRRSTLVTAGLGVTLTLCLWSPVIAQTQQPKLTEDEVVHLIKQSKNDLKAVAVTLQQRGVDFNLDAKVEKKLRKAGATDEIIQDVYKASPAGEAARKSILTSATGEQLEASSEEGMALQTMVAEKDPDRRLRMVSEFERQFPNSKITSYVYTQGALAYQEKGDFNNAVSRGEKSLKLDPDNLSSLLVVASSLTEPAMVSGSETEKTTRLAEAQADANHALKLIAGMPKAANETDEQAQKRKNELASDAHYSLGMVSLLEDNPGTAAGEFKTAISLTAQPRAQYYYRLGDAYSSGGKNAEALDAFTKAAELGKGTVMEQLAQKRIDELKKGKP
jgi:tetratricopeptide (TPR) repeat protein